MVDIMSGKPFDVYMCKKKFTANIENGILKLCGNCVTNDLLFNDEFVCSIDNKSALIGIHRIISPNMVAIGCGELDVCLYIYTYSTAISYIHTTKTQNANQLKLILE